MMQVRRIKLGSQGLEVLAQGLRCIGMFDFYGPPKPDSRMISLIHHTINFGITLLDTSNSYGPYTNKILLGKRMFLWVEGSYPGPESLDELTNDEIERELGIDIVTYGPLGRGFLSSGPESLEELTKDEY
ncbi:hypothetical protein FEM48_Zijuj07G0033600 [Ziziphus jujuba var. spinosa]|uniref:NADP-dependent oxidoreductase domain-containing protein n=1 Tax=Ziziphus jujuba var. spinosa TaxID=714518 RepID=A0A978V259_ZIZJJ|nr:hypothetical protein FEM48_Zijuj07G0033600 [Ziziphus jujuba var. spinosa]